MLDKRYLIGFALLATVSASPSIPKESHEEVDYAGILEELETYPGQVGHLIIPSHINSNPNIIQPKDAELIDHPPRGRGARVKKQVVLQEPYQWQYFVAPGAPGIVHYWYYPPLPSVPLEGAAEHPVTSVPNSTPSWIHGGKSDDEVLVDQLYSKHPKPSISPGYSSTLRPPVKSDQELVDELYQTNRRVSSPSPIDPLINSIQGTQKPVTGFRTAHWQGPVQGHYDTPQTRLSNTGHVIIHDDNH